MRIFERLLQPHESFQDPSERRLIRFFLMVILVDGVISLFAYFPLSHSMPPRDAAIAVVGLVGLSAFSYGVGRSRHIYSGLYATLFMLYLIIVGIILASPSGEVLLAIVFPILIASIFLSMQMMVFWALLCVATALIIPAVVPGDWGMLGNTYTLIMTITILTGIGVFLRNQNARETRTELMMRRKVEAELRESRHFIERITITVPDYIFIYDLTQNKTIYANRSREGIMGYPPLQPHENEDAFAVTIIHPDDRAALREIGARIDAARHDGIFTSEYRIKFADGSWHWVFERRAVFKRDAQGNPIQIFGVIQDITVRKTIELAESERRLFAETLRETSALVNSSLDTEEVLELIADNIHRIVPADGVTVMLIDGDQIQLSVVRGARQDVGSGEHTGRAACSVIKLAVMRKILETQMTLRIPDVRQVPDYVSLPGVDSIRAYLGIPLWARGQIIGVIHLEHRIPDFYTEEHVTRLQMFAEQVSSALQNAHLHEQSQLLSASNERQRIARDLHDSVTQTLFAASMVAQTLPILWDTNREGVRGQLDNLSLLTRGALADMRTLLVELRPSALENADIGELLRYLLDALATRHQVTVSLTLEGKEGLPGEIQIAFYRIAQEGLNNIAKHARAKQVTVCLVRQTHQVKLTITDDGRGFDTTEVGSDRFGLSIMRERADSVGATLTVDSAPGKGCCVEIAWQDSPTFALIQEGIR